MSNHKKLTILFCCLAVVIVIVLAGCGKTNSTVAPTQTATTQSVGEQCLTCHSSKELTMKVGEETVPLYVDKVAYSKSKHGNTECIVCHTTINPTPPHNAKRIYGSWARFSAKNTDVTKTLNFYSVTAEACVTCHKDQSFQAFGQSEHATIKDMKFTADGKPRVEHKLKGTDGKEYVADENFDAADCERCHINTNCAACHWKTQIKQKQSGSALDLWTKYDKDSNTSKGGMTEYGMDWTFNVAAHDFVGKAELTKSSDLCEACHTGYYQGDKSIAAIGTFGMGVRRHPQSEELQLSAQRGVHETLGSCTNCHKDLHSMKLKNTEQGGRLEGKTQCINCHADKSPKGTHVDVTCIACHAVDASVMRDEETKKVVATVVKHNVNEPWPSHNLTKDVQCNKCHVAGNKIGAKESVTPGKNH
ncbi:MAG: cytochrome c3 family protein [Desulfitobacteriaceae bacterium]|nr:cytochrome c3 family protein [Desulfitobacteriaceae bacterium]